MALPLTEAQARKATRWLVTHFGDSLRRAAADTPFSPELLCGIACQETAFLWIPWIDRGLTPAAILGRSIGDASGDLPNTSSSAFPRDTGTFRNAFGDSFTDMLIAEANASRALRNLAPKPWVYKGYGIFQYDLQHVRHDERFFRERQWYAVDACLDRAIKHLQRTFLRTGELWAAVKAYNGTGPRAEEYRDHVKIFTQWAHDEVASMPLPFGAGSSAVTERSIMSKSRAA